MISTTYIPVTLDYIIENVVVNLTLKVADVFYLADKSIDDATDADIKAVKNSAKLKKAFESIPTTGKMKKETAALLSPNQYFIKTRLSEKMLNEYIKLTQQIKKLEDEKSVIENLIRTEAAIYYDNNAANRPDLTSSKGIVNTTLAVTSSTDRPFKLRNILADRKGDYVKKLNEWDITAKAKKIINTILSKSYTTKTYGDLAKQINQFAGSNVVSSIEELKGGFKKTLDANIKYIKKTYNLSDKDALAVAREQILISNYEEILAFATTCEVDISDKVALETFFNKIANVMQKKVSHRIEVKPTASEE